MKSLIESVEIKVGCFRIKVNDIVIVDILPDEHTIGEHLDFIVPFKNEAIKPISSMVSDLESRGIKIDTKITDLIQSGFFSKNFDGSLSRMFHSVAIIKGRATICRSPEVIIRKCLPYSNQ